MARLELYGTRSCPHTSEIREWLEFRRQDFVEYDVENDVEARRRFGILTGGRRTIPLLVEEGKVVLVGWQGRGCGVSGD